MKFGTIDEGDVTRVVLIENDRGVLLSGLPGRSDPTDVLDLIVRPLTEGQLATARSRAGLELASLRWRPPILRTPKNIFCVGVNYREHLGESVPVRTSDSPSLGPCWFTKPHTSLAAHREPLIIAQDQTSVDYEGEVAAVIGRRCSRVSVEAALGAVFGYTILNDVSNRDLQRDREEWFYGKAADGYAPCGPWIVTADEIGDPQRLQLETRINDKVRQRASTQLMIHSFAELIADLSTAITLEPGDIIAGGTPAGVGMATGSYLRAGDHVVIEVAGIGELHTPVVAAVEPGRSVVSSGDLKALTAPRKSIGREGGNL